eukprot:COSAG01_NODE_41975_length_445_cov_0.549133_1_plen_34_part_10
MHCRWMGRSLKMQKWQDVLGTVDAGGSSSSTSVR